MRGVVVIVIRITKGGENKINSQERKKKKAGQRSSGKDWRI